MNSQKKRNLSLLFFILTLSTAASVLAAEDTHHQRFRGRGRGAPIALPTTTTPQGRGHPEPSEKKTWNGPYEFTMEARIPDSHSMGRVRFTAQPKPLSYDLTIPNPAFPSLHLHTSSYCDGFYWHFEQYVQQMTISNPTFLYVSEEFYGIRRKERLSPPYPIHIPCQLHSCHFSPNYTTGTLDLTLEVLMGPPEKNIILTDIAPKIPNLPSFPIPFKEIHNAEDGSVVCTKGDGRVLLATGGTRQYSVPRIKNYLLTPLEKVVASYQPSTQEYETSFFITICPKNPPRRGWDDLELYSGSDEEEGDDSRGEFSERSSYSETEGDALLSPYPRNQQFAQDPYKFYKIEGKLTELSAHNNPFMVLDKNGQSYYTRAFQVNCYPFIEGVMDRTQPHIIQWFVKSEVMGGKHECSQGGIGLRWTIFDEENTPLYPAAFHAKSLDKAYISRNILTLRIDQSNSLAPYNLYYIMPSDLTNHPLCSTIDKDHAAYLSRIDPELKTLYRRHSPNNVFGELFTQISDPAAQRTYPLAVDLKPYFTRLNVGLEPSLRRHPPENLLYILLITDLKSVFIKDSEDIRIKILKGEYMGNYYPVMAEVLRDSTVKSLQILIDSPEGYRRGPQFEADNAFLTVMKNLSSLTHFKMEARSLVLVALLNKNYRNGRFYSCYPTEGYLPSTIQSLDLSEFLKESAKVGSFLANALGQPFPTLKKASLGSEQMINFSVMSDLGRFLSNNPQLEELQLTLSFMYDPEYNSQLNYAPKHSSSFSTFEFAIMSHPNLKHLTWNIKSYIPKGKEGIVDRGPTIYEQHFWHHWTLLRASVKSHKEHLRINFYEKRCTY